MTSRLSKGDGLSIKPPEKPKCSVHRVDMVYLPDQGFWKCSEPECKRIRTPEAPPEDAPKHLVRQVRGNLTLLVVRNEIRDETKYLLRSADEGTVVDITRHVVDVTNILTVDEPNKLGLLLHFTDVIQVTE